MAPSQTIAHPIIYTLIYPFTQSAIHPSLHSSARLATENWINFMMVYEEMKTTNVTKPTDLSRLHVSCRVFFHQPSQSTRVKSMKSFRIIIIVTSIIIIIIIVFFQITQCSNVGLNQQAVVEPCVCGFGGSSEYCSRRVSFQRSSLSSCSRGENGYNIVKYQIFSIL